MAATRKGYFPIAGWCPNDGDVVFWLSESRLRELQRRGPERHYFDALLLPEILVKPTSILFDLQRDNHEDSRCYCGIPRERYQTQQIKIPFPKDRILLAFIDSEGTILDWELRQRDPQDERFPANWQADFGNPLWPPN